MNPTLSFAIEIALKSALILAAAFGAAYPLRQASASARHLLWLTAIIGILALPCLSIVTPAWTTAQPMTKAAQPTESANAPQAIPAKPEVATLPPTHSTNWPPYVMSLWAAGALFVIGRLLTGTARTRQLARKATRIQIPELLSELTTQLGVRRPVHVMESGPGAMPMTWGLFHPTILLPENAHQWPPDRLRIVLSHELVHVQRFDYLTQILSQIACAVYWFNPLVWFAVLQLRKERERACDDGVLHLGARASSYAEHLLHLARSLRTAQPAWSAAIAMASPSNLEDRLVAVLDRDRNRKLVSRRGKLLTAVAVACLMVPFAALRAPAQAAKGTISGTVYDASGAAVPKAIVTASNLDTHTRETGVTNEAGEYRFALIPTGRYEIEVKKPGFAVFRQNALTLAQDADLHFDPKLQIGTINENIDVLGTSPARQLPIPGAAGSTPQRIRIGGNVQATKLIAQVKPVYPESMQQQGIEGTVLLQAVIATDGSLLSVGVLNTLANPELAAAAMDAVKQWRYEPTLLNGMPVEVVTTISVNYRLQK